MSASGTDVDRLADLGQGFLWHLDDRPDLAAAVPAVRKGLAADGAEAGDSPFLPEGAVALAGRATATLEPGARVLTLDVPASVVEALAVLGFDVVAAHDAVPAAAYRGVADRRGVEVREAPLRKPVDAELREAFAAAVVDVLRHPTSVVPLASRALAAVPEGGRVSLALHPLQRDHLRVASRLLPARLVDRHDESCARMLATAGARGAVLELSDFPWDLWVTERTGDGFSVGPSSTLGAEEQQSYDPGFLRHGTVEIHDIDAAVTPAELDAGMAAAVERAGLNVVAEGRLDRDRYLHRYRALADGGHLALAIDREAGLLSLEFFRWSPWVEVQVVTALLDHLPRQAQAVRFDAGGGR